MDLSAIQIKETATLELTHPATDDLVVKDKKGKPFTITVYGSDSKHAKELMKQAIVEASQKRALKAKTKRSKDSEVITLEQLNENEKKGVEMLAKCTASCYLILDGKEVDCTFENMVDVYTRFPWVREQVDFFMSNKEHFVES